MADFKKSLARQCVILADVINADSCTGYRGSLWTVLLGWETSRYVQFSRNNNHFNVIVFVETKNAKNYVTKELTIARFAVVVVVVCLVCQNCLFGGHTQFVR